MNQRLVTRLLAALLLISLVGNVWMLLENRRLLNEWAPPVAATMQVHVIGAVYHPGVYSLPKGSRVSDALTSAGGTLPDAILGGTNLAKPLYDGEQVSVDGSTPTTSIAQNGGSTGTTPAGSGSTTTATRLININTAGTAELDTLPAIGPSTAKAIIYYRQEHGAFAKIEDLVNVPGIGEITLAKFKDLITVK